jgi:hypothetical protein
MNLIKASQEHAVYDAQAKVLHEVTEQDRQLAQTFPLDAADGTPKVFVAAKRAIKGSKMLPSKRATRAGNSGRAPGSCVLYALLLCRVPRLVSAVALSSVALACKGPLNARLATGVGLSFFLFVALSARVLLRLSPADGISSEPVPKLKLIDGQRRWLIRWQGRICRTCVNAGGRLCTFRPSTCVGHEIQRVSVSGMQAMCLREREKEGHAGHVCRHCDVHLPARRNVARAHKHALNLEGKKERSTPVARRVLRGHELDSGHRTYLCLVIQGSLIL